MSVATVDSSTLLNPNQKYPSTLTWKHRPSLQSLCINFGGELSTIATLMFCSAACAAQQLRTVEPCPVISPKRMSIHRYASFCNAPFSRMQSIPEKCMIHLTQLDIVSLSHVRWSTGVLSSLHVNPIQSYHLHARQYTDMHPFSMHRFKDAEHSWKVYDTFNTA